MKKEKKNNFKLANSILGWGIKTSNAFTLIELLAIIVILAIIAVITVPIILNVIENSKKGAIKDSAYGYKDAINKYYVTKLSEDQSFRLDGTYTINSDGTITGKDGVKHTIPFSGNTPIGGTLTYEDNVLKSGNILFDGYTAEVADGDIGTVSKGSGIPKLFIEKVTTQVEGEITTGDEVKIGTEHFYVVSSDETETVLLAKYNLYVGGTKTSGVYIPYGDEANGMQNATMLENNGVTVFSSDEQKGTNYSDYEGSIARIYVNEYGLKIKELGVDIIEATLITHEQLSQFGCKEYGNCPSKYPWLYNTSYWTKSSSDSSSIYAVNSSSYYSRYTYYSVVGIRPVIVVNTSDM